MEGLNPPRLIVELSKGVINYSPQLIGTPGRVFLQCAVEE
jgi:hypothetical protein